MNDKDCQVVGLRPWLPWPLCAWGWWTKPVRGERLAVLRIAVAACLLIDILTSYRPQLQDFFGQGGLGGSRLFAYYAEAPNFNWSLLRGFSDPVLGALAVATWLTLTLWLAVGFCARLTVRAMPDGSAGKPWGTLGWLAAGVFMVLAVWSRALKDGGPLLRPWQDDPWPLDVVFWTWVAATSFLLIGWQTRLAAVLTWALSMSFATANPNIDNAGDVVRGITLFYFMLCPCGAVWSMDWLIQRRRAKAASNIYVWPWPLRLLLLQLALIYFMNGLYKLSGADWPIGRSLYFVLCDLTLTRFSFAQMPVPFVVARVASWLVLAWELSFPILISFRRTRGPALAFGIVFHLGILATMELGGFVPYVLCLYLPLLPWERWLGEGMSPEYRPSLEYPTGR